MKTYLDCYPCFFRQVIEASRYGGLEEKEIQEILIEIGKIIADFPLDASPPKMAIYIHDLIREKLGSEDPYQEIKRASTDLALGMEDDVRQRIRKSDDPLKSAVQFAIAGNIIDYGAKTVDSVEEELFRLIDQEEEIIRNESDQFFDYQDFKSDLLETSKILYLGDNAGETVFDKLLIQEIHIARPDAKILYAVRGKPIINDAVMSDAVYAGLDKVAEVIESGADAPGTLLERCREDFLDHYYSADIIISKGQGNFEGLSERKEPIYFLLMAKCPVVAKHVGCNQGDILLLSSR